MEIPTVEIGQSFELYSPDKYSIIEVFPVPGNPRNVTDLLVDLSRVPTDADVAHPINVEKSDRRNDQNSICVRLDSIISKF